MENSLSDLNETLVTLTSDIVAAHVSNNDVSVTDLPSLISNVYGALAGLGKAGSSQPPIGQAGQNRLPRLRHGTEDAQAPSDDAPQHGTGPVSRALESG